jgi:hypothetical protein
MIEKKYGYLFHFVGVAVGEGDHVHGTVHPAPQVQGVLGGVLHYGEQPHKCKEYLEAYSITVS